MTPEDQWFAGCMTALIGFVAGAVLILLGRAHGPPEVLAAGVAVTAVGVCGLGLALHTYASVDGVPY